MTTCNAVDYVGALILGLVALGLVGVIAHMLLDGIREWIDWTDKRRRSGNG